MEEVNHAHKQAGKISAKATFFLFKQLYKESRM